MGAEQDELYAARRAKLEWQFYMLPVAGSPAYWRAVEAEVEATALPLEVLVRCFRERWNAGARADVERIYEIIVRRAQAAVRAWAFKIARHAPRERVDALAEELEQECDVALWHELCKQGETFLAERFTHKLGRIEQHTAQQVMEREGLWQRPGVQAPTRVPRSETERLDVNPHEPDGAPLRDRIYDTGTEDAFERVELEQDVKALLDLLAPEDSSLLYHRHWSDLSTEEIAGQLGVTDRTVRNRLQRIYAELRRLIKQSQEDANG